MKANTEPTTRVPDVTEPPEDNFFDPPDGTDLKQVIYTVITICFALIVISIIFLVWLFVNFPKTTSGIFVGCALLAMSIIFGRSYWKKGRLG